MSTVVKSALNPITQKKKIDESKPNSANNGSENNGSANSGAVGTLRSFAAEPTTGEQLAQNRTQLETTLGQENLSPTVEQRESVQTDRQFTNSTQISTGIPVPAPGSNPGGFNDEPLSTLEVASVAPATASASTNSADGVEMDLFIGDPPVNSEWLAERNAYFDELRSDYNAGRESFDGTDAEFLEHYLAIPNNILNRLAVQYEVADAAELIEQFPDIVEIAVRENRSQNAGPGLNGQSLISPEVLIMIDMQLSDPDVVALMEEHDEPVALANNASSRAQMYLYGEKRFEQIQKYHAVMERVRDDYLDVLHTHGRAQRSEFVERPTTEAMNQWRESHQLLLDEAPAVAERAAAAQFALSGPKPHEIYAEYRDRVDASNDAKPDSIFHVDQLTDWYVQQDTSSTRLFNAIYGASDYQEVAGGAIRNSLTTHEFDGGGWGLRYQGTDGGMWRYNTGTFINNDVKVVDFENLPDLHDPEAIMFSPGVGWYTPNTNIVQESAWFEDAIDIVIIGGVGLYFGGVGAGLGAGIGGVGGAIIGGAIGGGLTSAAAGIYYGNFDWDNVWDGALAGGLTAGLSNIRALQQLAQVPGGNVVANVVIQGTVSEVVYDDLEGGALNGLLSGISDQMFTDMNLAIDESGLTGVQEIAARQTARIVSTAVRVANTDGHPGQVLAQGLLNDLVQHVGGPIYDAGYEWGFELGESIQDGFSSWFPSGGSAGGDVTEVPGGDRDIKTDEELRADIETYKTQFNAELEDAIAEIEADIAALEAQIGETPSNQPAHYLFNVQRDDLLIELGNLQELAADPNAAIVALLAASNSRDETGGFSGSDLGHLALDIVGLIPLVGEWADLLNSAWYAAEGRPLEAALSAIGAAPGPIGMSATVARWTSRAEEIGSLALGEVFEITKDMLSRGGKIAGMHNAGPNAPKFKNWLEKEGNKIVVQPDGSVTYTGSARGRNENFSVTFSPTGVPDFSAYSHGRVDIQVDAGARRGVTDDNMNQIFRNRDYSAASEMLWEQIKNDPVARSQFTPTQLRQLQAGRPQISNMTWHHAGHGLNANGTGPMMLVDSAPHSTFTHRGWQSYLRNGEI